MANSYRRIATIRVAFEFAPLDRRALMRSNAVSTNLLIAMVVTLKVRKNL